jgi:hypothetical protein
MVVLKKSLIGSLALSPLLPLLKGRVLPATPYPGEGGRCFIKDIVDKESEPSPQPSPLGRERRVGSFNGPYMKFSHTQEKRDGRLFDMLTDDTPPLPLVEGERTEVRRFVPMVKISKLSPLASSLGKERRITLNPG